VRKLARPFSATSNSVNRTKRCIMISPFSNFLRILAFPRVTLYCKYEGTGNDLFVRLSDAKKQHDITINRVLLDVVDRKFWIEAGVYNNITTFKASFFENRDGNFIRGSFTNGGTWLSYPMLILWFFCWLYFRLSQQDASLSSYLIFFALFHLYVSVSFNIHIQKILKFLANELGAYPSQGEIISNHS